MLFVLFLGFQAWGEDTELDTGPRIIPYNGLLEFDGQSFAGLADISFTLTDDGSCTFVENHEEVQVFAGRFSVNIGQPTGDLPACLFDANAVFLRMAVRQASEETPHVELSGRQRINPVPFAYWASEGSDFKVDGTLLADSAAITGNLSASTADIPQFNGDVTFNNSALVNTRLDITGDTGQLKFTTDQFDDGGDLATLDDYKILLYEGLTPETSYGLAIQGGTLVANTDSEFDFKVDNVDKLNISSSRSTFHNDADIMGTLSVDGNTILNSDLVVAGAINGPLTTADNVAVGGSLTVDGNLTVVGNLINVDLPQLALNGSAATLAVGLERRMCFLLVSQGNCSITTSGSNWILQSGGINQICAGACLNW